MKEIWKDIKGYEGMYKVSNLGNVKSLIRNIILKPRKTTGDLFQVVLYNGKNKQAKFIHRLVAEYFLDGYIENKEVGHLDGDKTNNSIDNLFISELDVSHNPIKKLYKYDLSKYEVEIKNNHVYIKEL